jgi:hypothetical protein
MTVVVERSRANKNISQAQQRLRRIEPMITASSPAATCQICQRVDVSSYLIVQHVASIHVPDDVVSSKNIASCDCMQTKITLSYLRV